MQTEATKTTKKDLAVKATNAVALTTDFNDGGWAEETVDTKDILIPKLLVMHPTSELVKEGKRNIGEVIRSTTEETVAARGETIEVIVFEKWKDWRIMTKKDGRWVYVRKEAWTPDNDAAAWEFIENGQEMRRDKQINFYAVIAKEAEAGKAFPCLISFSRTSFKYGMKIADAYSRALMDKQPPIRQTFKLSTELVKGEKESYFVFKSDLGRATTEAERANTMQWRKVVQTAKKSNLVVDDETDVEVTSTSQASNEEF